MERCVYCDTPAPRHPWAGIGREDLDTQTGPMVQYPVCQECHVTPTHRRRTGLKLHHYARAQAGAAVMIANQLDARSRAGMELAL